VRQRLLIEVESSDLISDEVASAIESREAVMIEMPGWGSALSGVLVGSVPVESGKALREER
jgi:hypothetical protein